MSVGHGCLLLRDAWALRSHFGVQFFVCGPFAWQIVFVEDRRNRAFRNAGFTVDALIWMDEENRFTFIETFYWTYDHAVCVFAVEAWLGDDMSH